MSTETTNSTLLPPTTHSPPPYNTHPPPPYTTSLLYRVGGGVYNLVQSRYRSQTIITGTWSTRDSSLGGQLKISSSCRTNVRAVSDCFICYRAQNDESDDDDDEDDSDEEETNEKGKRKKTASGGSPAKKAKVEEEEGMINHY